MGSFEEENLYQMAYDFHEPESIPPLLYSAPPNLTLNGDHTKFNNLQEILESGNIAETDVLGSVMKHMRKNLIDGERSTTALKKWLVKKLRIDGERSTTALKKWLVKKLRIDGYKAALCNTTWPTTLNCLGGTYNITLKSDYEYIEIIISEDKNGGALRVIVDTDFKSQFELARPTSTFEDLSNMMPSIFVGTEEKLKKIIGILCAEARNSFLERGLHVPPWTTSTYVHSKWFSACQKVI